MDAATESSPVLTGWQSLEALASSSLPPKEFWARFATGLREITGAAIVLGVHRAGEDQPWRVIASAVDGAQARRLGGEDFVKAAPDLATEACSGREFPRRLAGDSLAAAAPVTSRRMGEQAVLLALCAPAMHEAALDAQLRAAALVPATFEARLAIERAESDSRSLTNVLDLVAVTNAEEKFGAAALAFCNAVASQYGCDRVSLGWLSAGYSKLAAISRHEQVDRKMETPQRIEAAMDECLDQDDCITFPPPSDATLVTHDHQKLAGGSGYQCILEVLIDKNPTSLHLTSQGIFAAAALLEREKATPAMPRGVGGRVPGRTGF